jgi:hypothetical protein
MEPGALDWRTALHFTPSCNFLELLFGWADLRTTLSLRTLCTHAMSPPDLLPDLLPDHSICCALRNMNGSSHARIPNLLRCSRLVFGTNTALKSLIARKTAGAHAGAVEMSGYKEGTCLHTDHRYK